MAEIWKKTLARLEQDPSFCNMFHMMEQYGDSVAAELTDRSGKEIQRTYARYITMSKAACGHLQEQNLPAEGAVIGLVYETCMDWPVLLWAILMSGNIPLLMNPSSDAPLIQQLLTEARGIAYVAAAPIAGCSFRFISADELLKDGKAGVEKWGTYVALCTSGTTGNSRIFLYDGQTIANHILSFDEAKQKNPDMPFIEGKPCKLLAFLPFHHVFGFSVVYLLYSCTGKTLVYLPDKSVPSILGACQKHKVTHLYCIPMFFHALAAGITKQLGDKDVHKLSPIAKQVIKKKTLGTHIRSMITGGGHISETTLDVLNSVGYPLCNGFGMTETGIISVECSLSAQQRKKGSIGIPFKLTEWKMDVPEGTPGELLIRGGALYAASMVDGQIVPRDPKAWFSTGDLVTKKPDGLYISGRLKDVIIGASGENIYPEDLEDSFSGIPGVKNFCLTGIRNGSTEEVVLVVETAPAADRQTICSAVKAANANLQPSFRAVRIYFAEGKLPVSGSMKVKRGQIKKGIEEGTFPCTVQELYLSDAPAAAPKVQAESTCEAYEATEEFKVLLKRVKAITAECLNLDEAAIGDTDHLMMKLGGDSLTIMGMFVKLENEYDFVLVDNEMARMENCYLIAKTIYCHLHGIANDAMPSSSEPIATTRITNFAESEEYQYMLKRMEDTFHDGINPYFISHDSLIRDTSVIHGKEVINLGSYNYLGMSGNPETAQAAIDAIRKYGTSASGSRTLAGEKTLYRELEKTIANWKHTEDAIVCTGGWATNLAFVSCFARKGDFIVYDQLSHNSLTEGVRLSTADSRAFAHNNLNHLEDILKAVEGRYNKVLIIVEGVYSMDGDIAPIPRFVELKKKYNCFLMVDEAHSGGVLGDHAGGVDDYFHLDCRDIDIKYGTMSKALGTCGGYVAADHSIVEYLRYNMNGFVFTAGIAPPLAAACMKAIEIIQRDNSAVTKLHENIAYFVRRAKEEGMNICLAGESAIVPVLVGTDADAARISAILTERGVFVPPAMYPAVPKGQSRLRFTISATHSIQQLEKAITETAAILRQEGFIK